jgi:hypothetical protein
MCSVLAISLKPLLREKAVLRQHCIEDSCAMSLAQYKTVAVRPMWLVGIYPEDTTVENCQNVSHGKAGADV